MTWLLVLGWALGAIAFWLMGRPIAGQSAAGQRALPIVAAFWPVFTALGTVIGLVALVELLAEEGLAAVFGRDEDQP